MQAGTTGPPLVAVHSWVTEPANYQRLSDALGGQLIYSLLPPDPASGGLPRRVSTWVDHHEATFESLGLEPPWRFVGWSFGGILAAELARRRRARGEEVAYVGMVDTLRPRLTPLTTNDYIWYHLSEAASLPEGLRAGYLYRKGRALATRRFPRTAAAAARTLHVIGRRQTPTPQEPRRASDPLQVAVWAAYLNYQGPPLDFPVDMYYVATSAERSRGPVLGWLPFLHGGYSQREVHGDHFTIFEPANVASIASAMAADLDGPGAGS